MQTKAIGLSVRSAIAGLGVGFYFADASNHRQTLASQSKNYTDRADICLEAASLQ